jgi:hypothetical protein
VKELKKRFIQRGIHLGMIQSSPKFVVYFTFLVYFFLGNRMSSEKIFFTITSLYTVVLIMMHFTPEAIAAIGEMFVSTNRIEVRFVKIHIYALFPRRLVFKIRSIDLFLRNFYCLKRNKRRKLNYFLCSVETRSLPSRFRLIQRSKA